MDAARRLLLPPWRAERTRLAACVATLALAAMGALLAARRLAGAFTLPLGVGRLAATLILAAAIVFAARAAWRRARQAHADPTEIAFAWVGTVTLWLVCLGCAPPSTQSYAWLLWIMVVAVDHVSRQRFLAPAPAPNRVDDFAIPPLAPRRHGPSSTFEGGGMNDGHIMQELARVRSAEGVESMRGTLRADFAAGQRHATLHVGFCPPLERLPVIEVELVDGPDATVKVTQVLAHGARFDLRLAEPAEEACSVVVEFGAAPSAPLSRRG